MILKNKFLWIAILIFIVDRIAKLFAFSSGNFEKNYGIAFSLLDFPSLRWLFVAITIAILIFIVYISRRKEVVTSPLLQFSLSLILAGLLSNLTDRVFYGFIIDYIKISIIPTFNLADAANFAGALLILDWLAKEEHREKSETRK